MPADTIKMFPKWKLEKWNRCRGQIPLHLLSPEAAHLAGLPPDEVVEWEGNLALNAGLGVMIDLLIGSGSPTPFSNANARLYVGDGTTAASASQTDLQGTNKLEKAMDTGFPIRSGNVATWKATYGSLEANFAWEEGGVKNAAGTPNGTTIILFNRKVQSLGTKTSGAVWTLTLEITFQ
jgi:hypothetical protein